MDKIVFELKKVVCPHKHMPKDIKDAFFEAFRDEQRNNNSYITFTVGEYDCDENDSFYDENLAKFCKWTLENFKKNESIVLRYWW